MNKSEAGANEKRPQGGPAVEEGAKGAFDLRGQMACFDNDEELEMEAVESVDALKELLGEKVEALGENRFYMVRIDGTFPEMHVRSELAQEEPYQPLAKVLETDQTFYDFENVKGTVVGLYCLARGY